MSDMSKPVCGVQGRTQGGIKGFIPPKFLKLDLTSGYTTWFTAGGAIRIAHYDVIDDAITRKLQQIEKNGDHLAA